MEQQNPAVLNGTEQKIQEVAQRIRTLREDLGISIAEMADQTGFSQEEYELLECMLENKGTALSRERILKDVWDYDYYGDTNVVDVYIRYLRQKIDDKFGISLIHTVRGIGYIIKDENK